MAPDLNKYSYLTVYKKDYVKRPFKLVRNFKVKQEYKDPIFEGYKKYLVLLDETVAPPYEEEELYLQKLERKNKIVTDIYFQKPLNKDVLLRHKIRKGIVSEYQTNFCDIEKDIQYYLSQRNKKYDFDIDADIPLTTYSALHRDPAPLCGHAPYKLQPLRPREMKNFLGTVSKPMSEYTGHIGQLGELISESCYLKCRT